MRRIRTNLSRLRHDEAGAVTVDWVVLTAATMGLGIAVMLVLRPAAKDLTEDSPAAMTNYSITTTF
ncbi:MAG: hypothetical protein ACU0BS_11305 [Hasllibacter sp.]